MELFHNAMSVCSQKVRIVLAEKGLQPEVEHDLDLRAGDSRTPQFLKLNPKGVVPVLVDQGQVIPESTVICEYLEEAYPQTPLRPTAASGRARMRLWTVRPDAGLHHACGYTTVALTIRHQFAERGLKPVGLPPHVMALVEQGLDHPEIPAKVREYAAMVRDMAGALENGPWLAGQDYSLADAAMLPYVLRLEHLAAGWIWRDQPWGAAIDDWLARSRERPGWRGVADWLRPPYVESMGRHGREAESRLKGFLAAP